MTLDAGGMKVILTLIAAVWVLWLPLIVWLYVSQRKARHSSTGPTIAQRRMRDSAVVAIYCFALVELGLFLTGRGIEAITLAVLCALPLLSIVRRSRQ